MSIATLERPSFALPDDFYLQTPPPVHLGPTWTCNPVWDRKSPLGQYILPEITLGWQAIAWVEGIPARRVEGNLRNDDDSGPFRLTFEQKRLLLWWYAIDENGIFAYREGILQRLKGWGKDPFAAVLAAIEFVGPCRFDGWASVDIPDLGLAKGDPVAKQHPRAWIQIAAVSKEQTVNTMTLFPGLFSKACIAEHSIDLGKEIIYAHKGARRIQAVTSSPRALEGGRPTLVVKNEALALDTPIPTPDGWTTMGELRDGDTIFGDDGQPCIVTKVHPVQEGRRCFEVTFADRTSIVASDGHWWQTRVAASDAKPRRRTTLEMFEDGRDRRFMTPRAGARITKPVDLPVDPYLLGAWLGDGSTGACNITASTDDAPELQAQLALRGVESHWLKADPLKPNVARVSFSDKVGFGAGMGQPAARALRRLPCFRDKHIPAEYLTAGTEQRLELLRGLMDTDGCISTENQAAFTGRKRLAHDVLQLVRSLGQLATVNFAPDPRSREGGTWRVTFTPAGGIQPFAFARKAARVRQTKRVWVGIRSIVEVESVPVRCISVDSPTRLFQAGEGGQVTSNTHHWRLSNEGHSMAEVIERNATKSKDGASRTLSITNAYEPSEDSVAQREREAWEDEQSGLSISTGVLYDSIEAGPDALIALPDKPDGSKPSEAETRAYIGAIINSVRGDAVWLNVPRIVNSILDRKNAVSTSRRFYYNQVVASEDAWADPKAIEAAVDPLAREALGRVGGADIRAGWLVQPHEEIVLFFDGSKSEDSTGLVGCRVSDGYVFTVGVWQKPRGDRGANWLAPREAIDDRVIEAHERFNVVAFFADPSHALDDEDSSRYWDALIDKWHRSYKDRYQLWATKSGDNQHSIMWDMTSPERSRQFTAAAERFITELESKNDIEEYAPEFTIDGHPALVAHMRNAKRYPHPKGYGVSLWKGAREASKKIDLAVCAVGARHLRRLVMNRLEEEKPKRSGVVW